MRTGYLSVNVFGPFNGEGGGVSQNQIFSGISSHQRTSLPAASTAAVEKLISLGDEAG